MLSFDNASVLAVLVSKLPKEQQPRALKYGIVGAYFFRFLSLLFASYLLTIPWLKIFGGVYLLWMTYQHFFGKEDNQDINERPKWYSWLENRIGLFWATVVQIEILDYVFGIDQIFAAISISKEFWVIFVGGAIGILAMRFVAQRMVTLIDKYPSVLTSAFLVICILGFRLTLDGIVSYIPSAHTIKEILESHYTDVIVSGSTLIIFLYPILFNKPKQTTA